MPHFADILPFDRKTGQFWDYPRITVHRRYGMRCLEYDLEGTGAKLSQASVHRIHDYFADYHAANGIVVKSHRTIMETGCGPDYGGIPILREHTQELAARLLIFLCDPASHTSTNRTDAGPNPNWPRINAKLTEMFPEFMDDPLRHFPIREAN